MNKRVSKRAVLGDSMHETILVGLACLVLVLDMAVIKVLLQTVYNLSTGMVLIFHLNDAIE